MFLAHQEYFQGHDIDREWHEMDRKHMRWITAGLKFQIEFETDHSLRLSLTLLQSRRAFLIAGIA